jgi:predicted nucleic acid-binding protein
MVIAYAILGVPDYEEESLEALRKADTLYAPASIEAELLNVLWQYSKLGVTNYESARLYDFSHNILTGLIPLEKIWADALNLAIEHEHSPYDTLFVASARLYNTLVITYDKKMLTLFPEYTIKVRDSLFT